MIAPAPRCYRFGDFRLDPAARELWRGTERLELSRLSFDGLAFLVENHERAVSRDELIGAVWDGAEIEDNQVTHLIMRLRKVLDDDSREPRFIRAVPGFGYRWVGPTEAVIDTALASAPPPPPPPSRSKWRWMMLAAVLLGAPGAQYLLRDSGLTSAEPLQKWTDGDIAMLLPVRIEADPDDGWIRLGLMDLMAGRLRAAGQSMVPSDTVVALSRGLDADPDPDELDRLLAATGARLVLEAEALVVDGGWRVSLLSLAGMQPRLRAQAEAEDVLAAARIAADRMALSLGLAPVAEPRIGGDLALLLHRTEAAMLAQQMDVARSLINAASEELRQSPEIRVQLAHIDFREYALDAAEAAFDALRLEPAILENPALHLRVLHGLSMIHFRRGHLDANWSVLEEAAGLVDQGGWKPLHAELGWLNVAIATTVGVRDGLEAARPHFVRARIALERTADVDGLAGLDNNIAGLEFRRGRHDRALQHLERAAVRFRALNDVGSELRTLFNRVRVHLNRLDVVSAMALEPRLEELMTLTSDPALIANAQLARTEMAIAGGRTAEAEGILAEVLDMTETRADLYELRASALVIQAEMAVNRGELGAARRIVAKVIERLPPRYPFLEAKVARAQLIAIRAALAVNELDAAVRAVEELERWARDRVTDGEVPQLEIDTLLAQAEIAAASGRVTEAEARFERALALAGDSRIPVALLHVCMAYVAWLAAEPGDSDPERALLVATHLDGYADHDYEAALVQLRAYQAAGIAPAWRSALERARALAGEREIPAGLSQPPL